MVTGLLVAAAVMARSTIVFGIVVAAAIFIPLEQLFALHPQKILRRGWKTDLVHFLVNNVLSTAGIFVVVVVFAVVGHGLVNAGFQAAVRAQPWPLQFLEALAITEVAGYWAHRATHRVPLLWRFHRVHHSITQMDWLASAHLHPVDQIFTRSCVIIPLFVLGFSKATFGAYLVFAAIGALFIHSNVRLRFGPLRWIIATPEFHHWHHANQPGAIDRNFAGQLPLLDVVFGTAHLPRRWPDAYGVNEPEPPTYLGQLAWPFRPSARANRARG